MDSSGELALFLKRLAGKTFDGPALGGFLEASASLPLELPLLGGMREFRASLGGPGLVNAAPVRAKLERRYLRLCFVQESLERIDFKKLKSGEGFEEFMLGQADFSRYALLDEKTFKGLFIDGLEDYPDAFFPQAFRMNREALRTLLLAGYARGEGKAALIKNNLFILSVMRTLHSSLDFAPLWDEKDVLNEMNTVLVFFSGRGITGREPASVLRERGDEIFLCLLSLFHHVEYRQEDGAKTHLFLAPFRGRVCLAASFRPLGKAHSLALSLSGFPLGTQAGTPRDLSPLGEGPCLRGADGKLTLPAPGPGKRAS
ncbi:MAG: hypothetical protein LBI85_01120 [Spirochaetaceae bacterium]|nr:hypothetical protein [Spirochaetaceae bacterium]